MSSPKFKILPQILEATRDITRNYKNEGTLHNKTPRLIREEVAARLRIDEGVLHTYRKDIKQVINNINHEDEETASEGEAEAADADDQTQDEEFKASPSPSPPTKPTPKANKPPAEPKKKKNARKSSPTSDAESAPPPKKRAKKSKGTFKSAEIVPTSDIEMDDVAEVDAEASASTSTAKKEVISPKAPVKVNHEPAEPGSEEESAPEASTPKAKAKPAKKKAEPKPAPKAKAKAKAKGSDNEDSDAPKKAKPKAKRAKKEVDKDEETIKRLKGLVVACGVRKVWSKEFTGLDTPSQQIRKLKEILASLGMTGRTSMEQAKAIRMKRELAQELEDVKKFEAAIVGRGRRSAAKEPPAKTRAEPSGQSDDEDEDEEEVTVKKGKRKANARQSIMAFLGDESD